jgi:tetratricopeptide (TPR) repeat protein
MQEWLEQEPGHPYACAKLGALEVADGDRIHGIALLREGLANLGDGDENAAERYELLLHLGIALSAEDTNQAIEFYKKALEQALDVRLGLGARLNLAALLLQTNKIDEAIQLTTTACQRAPEVALAWYNLGLMQRRKGEIKDALQSYERAISLEPSHAECHQNLAVARLVGGDIDGARASFREAISLLNNQGKGDQARALHDQVSGLVKLNEVNA